MHQETHSNFLGIFARKLERTGVQIARTEVCIAKKLKKKIKTKAHGYEAQTHAAWWIRILRMPQRRWIDPDPLKPISKGSEHRMLDRVWTDPVQRAYIKGLRTGSLIFLHRFSFFSIFLSSSLIASVKTLSSRFSGVKSLIGFEPFDH